VSVKYVVVRVVMGHSVGFLKVFELCEGKLGRAGKVGVA